MTESTLTAVSDILDSFEVEEITQLIRDQIMEQDNYSTPPIDQFKPAYVNYNRLLRSSDATEDEINEGKEKFIEICKAIIGLIDEKFDLQIDDRWFDLHGQDIPATTLALYSVFVLDFYSNIQELLYNYIRENTQTLYEEFKDVPRKPIVKVPVSPQLDVIMRNIYDICIYSINNLTPDSAIQYFDKGYLPMNLVANMLQNGAIQGNFITKIADLLTYNISFKSQIGFDILYKIQNEAKASNKNEGE